MTLLRPTSELVNEQHIGKIMRKVRNNSISMLKTPEVTHPVWERSSELAVLCDMALEGTEVATGHLFVP